MLNYQDLYSGFLNVMDDTENYSDNLIIVSSKWTNIFQKFYINMVAPVPGVANPNLFNSLNTFKLSLINSIQAQTIKQQLEILVQKLHLGVCTGVNMTGIYTTTPPSTLLKLQQCFNFNFPTKVIANMLATTIFVWVQTTFSVQTSSGVIIKWM